MIPSACFTGLYAILALQAVVYASPLSSTSDILRETGARADDRPAASEYAQIKPTEHVDADRSSHEERQCTSFIPDHHLRDKNPCGRSVSGIRSTSGTESSENGNHRILEHAFAALAVLQNEYFDPRKNTWPSAIDWTAAVTGTVVSAMLKTLTQSLESAYPESTHKPKAKMNLVASFYDQLISYYYGQDYLGIKAQAFDDMLWVVLGWIETATFGEAYGKMTFPDSRLNDKIPPNIDAALASLPWRGHFWLPSFYNRSQMFWEFASHGWDNVWCHGGMNWNPQLETYKNAVTNELWIAASISMYQYYEKGGDASNSPSSSPTPTTSSPNPAYLEAAERGYEWLMQVNMTNSQGLFVDGYHINKTKPGNVECDVRDEMVYTYNQGVLLTGQRGLWTASGRTSYLKDGHGLIQSVIRATGWNLARDSAVDDGLDEGSGLLPWRGIGRGGILEEKCDASGTCSQDGQTFKGIFFHHLTAFCQPLDLEESRRGIATNAGVDSKAFARIRDAHAASCRAYLGWVRHNAVAALKTRDDRGRFGMWWGAPSGDHVSASAAFGGSDGAGADGTDYRNFGTPDNELWGVNRTWQPGGKGGRGGGALLQVNFGQRRRGLDDPNQRGRGRTVETQVGGLAVVRAWWELENASWWEDE